MPKMTTLAFPALLAAAAAGATPAHAAHETPRSHGYHDARVHYASFGKAVDLRRDLNRLETRIDRAYARHRISWREARGLQRQVNRLQRQFRQSRRGGLTRYEARMLDARIARVKRQLRYEIRDANGRSDTRRRMARRF